VGYCRFLSCFAMSVILLFSYLNSSAQVAQPESAKWLENESVPTPRPNPYNLEPVALITSIRKGQVHAQKYPIEISGVLLPEKPFRDILDNTSWNPIKGLFNEIFKEFAGFKSFNGLFEWVGLIEYPLPTDKQQFQIALPDEKRPEYLLGYSEILVGKTKAFTMSCAACHSDKLFGQTILGMSKRFPRANDFFIKGRNAFQHFDPLLFSMYTGATSEEMNLLERSIANLQAVGLKHPQHLGLDTSLAQVALSLNRREPNAWADKSSHYERYPRTDILDTEPADSKPAVWWNVKYKNRWLSDGSVISGNPIYTNLLWNEIGRGSDLRELSEWLDSNPKVIQELTTAVFSTEAPRIEDFFPAERINKASAMRGEQIFNVSCARCHGRYEKNWSREEFQNAQWELQIKTFRVQYAEKTFVVDVGTDPYRREGMKSLEPLNNLEISQRNGIVIQPQQGYVPPPLVGIWARWPYLHNNSIPNLCILLTPTNQRPSKYYAGDPIDKDKHFDFECNGYPIEEKTPTEWMDLEHKYTTQYAGTSNSGHDQGIFLKDDKELLSPENIKDLIQFLQTL
jgi:cytochrome c553